MSLPNVTAFHLITPGSLLQLTFFCSNSESLLPQKCFYSGNSLPSASWNLIFAIIWFYCTYWLFSINTSNMYLLFNSIYCSQAAYKALCCLAVEVEVNKMATFYFHLLMIMKLWILSLSNANCRGKQVIVYTVRQKGMSYSDRRTKREVKEFKKSHN